MKLNNFDLNKLATFLAVAERGSVTSAAAELARTRSAVSQSVAALEQNLGLPLFHRIGKRLVLTPAGERLRDSARTSQQVLQSALEEIVDSGGSARGAVRAGIFLGFPRRRLAEVAQRFSAAHPRASLRFVFAPENDLHRRLLRGRLDLSVSFRSPGAENSRIRSRALFKEELVLVSGDAYLREGLTPAELERTPLIDYYQSDPLIDRWLAHHYPGRRIERRVAVWAATTDLVLDLILAGAGAGVVPRYLVAETVASGRLRLLRRKRRDLADTIWLNERRDAYRDAAHRAFCELMLAAGPS